MSPSVVSAPPARRTLSPTLAYALVAGVVGLALFASITPSPLYGTYRELWGFSPLVLTLVYGDVRVRRAHHADPRRPRSPTRSVAGPSCSSRSGR